MSPLLGSLLVLKVFHQYTLWSLCTDSNGPVTDLSFLCAPEIRCCNLYLRESALAKLVAENSGQWPTISCPQAPLISHLLGYLYLDPDVLSRGTTQDPTLIPFIFSTGAKAPLARIPSSTMNWKHIHITSQYSLACRGYSLRFESEVQAIHLLVIRN